MEEIFKNGVLRLSGAIAAVWPEDGWRGGVFTPDMVRDGLSRATGDLTVILNSRGGNAVAAEEIRMMLVDHPGRVTVRVTGDCCSAASLLAMAGDEIEMSLGSTMMIHDPSILTIGNAEDHDRASAQLEALSATYAAVYAARSGKPVAEVRDMMRAETWLTAQAAVEAGFATRVVGEAPDGSTDHPAMCAALMNGAKARFSDFVTMAAPIFRGAPELQSTSKKDKTPMTTNTPQNPAPASAPVMTADQAVEAERARVKGIRAVAAPLMQAGAVGGDLVDALIDDGSSIDAATAQMNAAAARHVAALSEAPEMTSRRRPAEPTNANRVDEAETRRAGVMMALDARLSGEVPNDDRARPYMDMTFHEMAAVSMGQQRPAMGSFASRSNIVEMAMTTSDFPHVLSGALNRIFERQYDAVERTYTEFGRPMTFNDFREHDVTSIGRFPQLQKIGESGEIKFGSISDGGEKIALASYASGLLLSRQALVNDDLGAIQDVVNDAAAIVPEFEEEMFWKTFLSNPKLADGVALFHSSHKNLAASGSALSVDAVSAGRKALREQTEDAAGKRKIAGNAPSLLIVGPENETAAEQLIASITAAKSSDVNPFSGRLKILVTSEITDKQWFLAVANSKRSHVMKFGHLRDSAAPRVRVNDPFGKQGVGVTIEHDFGCGAVNYRGAYKNAGQ